MRSSNYNFRFLSLLGVFSLVILVWIVYLYIIQIMDPHGLDTYVKRRYSPRKSLVLPQRGNIYDRNHELLVSSTNYYQIDLDCGNITNYCSRNDKDINEYLKKAAKLISQYSNLEYKKISKKLKKYSTRSIYLTNSVKEADLHILEQKFKEEKIPGLISKFSYTKRSYPKGRLAARLLGLVNEKKDNDAIARKSGKIYRLAGACGLEATFDSYLKGEYGWKKTYNDGKNQEIALPKIEEKKVQNGSSIVLTIDSYMQEILENKLEDGIKQYNAKNAIGVFMDVKTGKILAISGIGREDKYQSAAKLRSMPNYPVSFLFEPGSTFKPFTALLALEENIFKPDDEIDCRTYKLPGRTIRDSHPFKKLSFRDIIAHSSNVGISKIVEQVGAEPLYTKLIDLGFGHKTDSNIQGEAAGIFRKLSDWQGFSLHSISFGQEISVTALQLATSYATLANGGKVMRPMIWEKIVDDKNNIVKSNKPFVRRSVSDPASLDTLKVFLQNVVEYGTATSTKLDYISVGGKTGTAEKIEEGKAGYSKDKYTSVFAGFFPVENPSIAGVIVYDEPDYKYRFGSMSAAPTFKEFTEDILSLPSCKVMSNMKKENNQYVKMPDLCGLSIEKAKKQLDKNNIKYNVINSDFGGEVINQFPKEDIQFNQDQTVILVLGSEEKVTTNENFDKSLMPDLSNLSIREALKVAKALKVNLNINGRGKIYEQSIGIGQKVKFGQVCYVKAR